MRVRSTAVLALSTVGDRVVLTRRRREVADLGGALAVVFALQPRRRMLPVDIACDPPLLPRPNMEWLGRACRYAAWSVAGLVVLGFVTGPRVMTFCPPSKVDVARLTVAKYANEAYPLWYRDHPGQKCPRSLAELGLYMNPQDAHDPWGRLYAFTCHDKRLFAMSFGEDGVANTADDIWSHDEARQQ